MSGSDFEALVRKTGMSRRSLLRVMGAGAASAAAVPLLSACTGTSSSASTSSSTSTSSTSSASSSSASSTSAEMMSGSAVSSSATSAGSADTAASMASTAAGSSMAQVGGTVAFGSNASDAVPKAAYGKVFDAFKTASGATVKVNTVDHNSFQENINNYLQGSPDEVFTWFAGNRMQFFAAQGLLTPIDDVWSGFADQYSDAFQKASTAADGKKYFVPFYNYPWAFFYRKSVWAAKGYTVPKTLDELKTLATKMKADGLTPIAFADKDGWPAMGTFDYLNMRLNGYQFHIDLMAHKQSWTDPKVKTVFDTWKGLLPLHQDNPLGRTWQEAAQALAQKKAGMYLLGMFVAQQFTAADQADLDFFAFPQIDSAVGMDAVEAPIDGFLMSSKGGSAQAKALLTYLASPAAQSIYLASDPSNIAANKTADTSKYSALQKKAVELIGSAKSISQFLDRDTRPDFASPVVIPALQQFLKDGDSDAVTKSLESQAKTIFTS